MNLRGVDLNLLVILDALLDEVHVGRAAQRLNLSQPATSNALSRCRALFDDPLLVRAPGGLRRTPRADALREELRPILDGVGHLVDPTPPSLATLRRTVRMVLADHPADVLMAPLLARIADSAPGINIVLHPWHAGDEIDRLLRGELDLVTVIAVPAYPELRSQTLVEFGPEIVMRRGHPAAKRFSLEEWLRWPHVLVSGSGEERGPVDAILAGMGRERRVGAVVPSFGLAHQIVLETDMIAALPAQMLPASTLERLTILDPPVRLQTYTMSLVRHRRSDNDLAIGFVADAVRELIADQIRPANGLLGSA